MKDMKTFMSVLMIEVCIDISESHIAGFLGGFLCTSVYGCVFVCIFVWDRR